jgi:hypothetical protein
MISGLPLEVLGLLSPILSWVDGGEQYRPGQRNKFSISAPVQNWLRKELPTYSYDTLDEIREAAFDSRDSYEKNDVTDGFHLIHMLRKLSNHYFEWRGNKLFIKENRMLELHELAMRFPVQHLVRYRHVDAVARGYISRERALNLPVQMNKLNTSYQGLCTLVNRGLTEGHLHLGGVVGVEETWADHLLGWLSPRKKNKGRENVDCFVQLGRITLRLLAMGILYQHAIPYRDAGDLSVEILPFHLIRRLDRMYMNRDLLRDSRAHTHMMKQWDEAFRREFQPNEKQETLVKNLGKMPWKQLPQLYWLMELANPGMARVWFQDRDIVHKDRSVRPRGIRDRIHLLNRFHLIVQEFLLEKDRFNSLKTNHPNSVDTPEIGSREYSPSLQVEAFVSQVFTRYLVYHTHYWKQATQGGTTTGLRRFQYFYDAPERNIDEEERGEIEGLTLERLSRPVSLWQLEGRLTPPSHGPAKYIPWLLAFAQQAKKGELDKFGIVIHFKKGSHGSKTSEEGQALRKKYRLHVRENKQSATRKSSLRYGEIRRETRSDAYKLFRLLSSPHPVVPFIVGIDAASLELTTPPEVFAPAFRFLKDYPIEIRKCSTFRANSERHDCITPLVNDRLLGMTYHVGEDFRHLLSGLRAIHEVIEFLHPQPGDRLGHAIALGLDPGDWGRQMGYHAVVPKQEWLDTMVWVHNFIGAGNDLIGELDIEGIIQYFSKKIYGSTEFAEERDIDLYCNPITLYDSWRLRQIDPYSVENSFPSGAKTSWGKVRHSGPGNYCFSIPFRGDSPWQKKWVDVQKKILKELKKKVGSDGAYLLTKLYWFCSDVAREGRKPITIDMLGKKKLWLQLFRQVQEKLNRIVRSRHLVMEVNPSSNRIIGPMASMQEHPIFRLTLDKEGRPIQEGRVTINTDDPGVFATSLSHEFFLLGEVLLNRGVPEAEVMQWLEWLRKSGEDYSFLRTLPDCRDKRVMNILKRLGKRYEPLNRSVKGESRRYKPLKSHNKQYKVPKEEFNRLKERLEELERINEKQ